MLLFLSFVLAFCSLVYELVLSHLLAALLGGMLLRYTTSIALYITALGGGAYLLDRVFFQNVKNASPFDLLRTLLKVELALALAGALAPFVALVAASGSAFITQWVCYMLVCAVGLLSGFELPLLMRLGELKRLGYGFKVLSLDFVGTCVGCVLFPLLLLPYLGVFYAAALASSLNLILALVLWMQVRPLRPASCYGVVGWYGPALMLCNIVALIMLAWPRAQNFMIENFYL